MTLNPPPRTPSARATGIGAKPRSQMLHLKLFSILLPHTHHFVSGLAPTVTKNRGRKGSELSKKQSTLRGPENRCWGCCEDCRCSPLLPSPLAASLPTVLLSGSTANLISHKHRAESATLSTCVPQILWLGNLENLTIISTNIFFTIRSVSFREKLAWPDKIKICLTT